MISLCSKFGRSRWSWCYPPVWEHLGLAYSSEGKHRDAVPSFERAVKLMPSYKQAWGHLATEYRLVGRPADADKAAARAAALKGAPVPHGKLHA